MKVAAHNLETLKIKGKKIKSWEKTNRGAHNLRQGPRFTQELKKTQKAAENRWKMISIQDRSAKKNKSLQK